MDDHDAAASGERWAEVYDDWHPGYEEAAITTLAGLTRGGRALELGIGTGRIALPLAARGVEVHGIEASPAMVAKLKAKSGGASIPVIIGDFAEVGVDGQFALIFAAFNTLFALPTQEAQVRCFGSVAEQLSGDGVFVVEAFVPDLTRFSRGQTTETARVISDQVMLVASRCDPVAQQIVSQHVVIAEGGTRLYPVQLRYAWPAELDLMAQLAGLRLRHRWSGWQGEPFTASSPKHVSIYERASAG